MTHCCLPFERLADFRKAPFHTLLIKRSKESLHVLQLRAEIYAGPFQCAVGLTKDLGVLSSGAHDVWLSMRPKALVFADRMNNTFMMVRKTEIIDGQCRANTRQFPSRQGDDAVE